MMRFVVSLYLLILSNGILNASLTSDAVEFAYKFKKINSIIDDEVSEAASLKVCPNQNVERWVEKRLQPLEHYLMGFGTSKDPMVCALITSFSNFSLSLRYFYETDKTALRHLSPINLEKYTHSFKKTMLQHIEFSGTSLKIYMNMIFYSDPSKYAEFFPMHMADNHEIAMRSVGENLRNFYLSKSCYDLTLESDNNEAQIAALAYKTYKPFCHSWQKIVSASWGAHQGAFKRINPSAFKTQTPHISKTTQKIRDLTIDPLTWKKSLTHEHFALQLLSCFKNPHIRTVEMGHSTFLIIEEGKTNTPSSIASEGTSTMVSSAQASDQSDLSDALSQLTLSSSKQREEIVFTPQPSSLPAKSIVSLGDVPLSLSDLLSTPPIEMPEEEFFAREGESQTILLEEDLMTSASLESLPSVMDQLPPMFDFLNSLEESAPLPIAQSSRKGTHKKHSRKPKGNRASLSKASASSQASTSTPVSSPVTYDQGRTVLPLGRKMTPEAIVEFLKAMDHQSTLGKARRSTGVRAALSTLRGYKTMRLKKAYKMMLSIVPHVGLFESDRGKGSHCLLTIYHDGLPPKK